MARYAKQNFLTPKYFTETLFLTRETLSIPGGSQAIGFFSK